jgi:HlyD family secretion protein
MTTNKKSRQPLVIGLLGVIALALLGYGIGPGNWFGDSDAGSIEGAPVRRGPLRISVIESGNLKSKDSISLKSELEGQSTILYLIKEGSHVKTGELLCELDATKLVEQRVQQQITVRNSEAAWVKAKQNYEIQLSQNESDIAAAQRKSDFAGQDLQKYIDGDWPQKKKSGEEAILLAEEEVKRAEDKLEWSNKLEAKGFLTRTELEADKLSATSAGIKREQSRRALELLEQYDYPQQRKKFEADKLEADRGLDRAKLQAEARRVDAEAAMVTSSDKLGLEKERLAKLESQIQKARIVAPVDGMVVYAQQEGGRWGGGDPIQEGTVVRERQEIITLPSATTKMVAEVSLHESVLEQVQPGQRVTMTVDALPGRTFAGLVDFQSVLPHADRARRGRSRAAPGHVGQHRDPGRGAGRRGLRAGAERVPRQGQDGRVPILGDRLEQGARQGRQALGQVGPDPRGRDGRRDRAARATARFDARSSPAGARGRCAGCATGCATGRASRRGR